MPADPIPVRWTLRGAILTLPDEIDPSNSDQVHLALTDTLRAAPAMLVADMARTTYCCSAGVRALLMTHQAAEQAHTALRIAGVHPRVRRIFAVTCIDTILNVYPSTEAALADATVRLDKHCPSGNG